MDYRDSTGEDYPDVELDDGTDSGNDWAVDESIATVDRRAALEDIGRRIARDGFIFAERIA